MFIPHKRTRFLLRQFTVKGLSLQEFEEFTSLLQVYTPSLNPIVMSALVEPNPTSCRKVFKCIDEWSQLLHSLAVTSPACGLLHPSSRANDLVKDMCGHDITKDAKTMKVLQEEFLVLFHTIRKLNSYPLHLLKPLLECLLQKANAAFISVPESKVITAINVPINNEDDNELSYFPLLPKRRQRRQYEADKKGGTTVCTKKSSRHPSLLPGIFTLFCKHGKFFVVETRMDSVIIS